MTCCYSLMVSFRLLLNSASRTSDDRTQARLAHHSDPFLENVFFSLSSCRFPLSTPSRSFPPSFPRPSIRSPDESPRFEARPKKKKGGIKTTHLVNLAIANAVRARESAADGVSEGGDGGFRGGAPCGGLEGRASESGKAAVFVGTEKFLRGPLVSQNTNFRPDCRTAEPRHHETENRGSSINCQSYVVHALYVFRYFLIYFFFKKIKIKIPIARDTARMRIRSNWERTHNGARYRESERKGGHGFNILTS